MEDFKLKGSDKLSFFVYRIWNLGCEYSGEYDRIKTVDVEQRKYLDVRNYKREAIIWRHGLVI